jgi:hypothetical protein
MARLQQEFRPDEIEDSSSVVPKGDYLMHIIESDITDTKANDGGKIMTLVCELLEAGFEKRRIYMRLNYINKNAQTQQISGETLKSITEALGIRSLSDTSEMEFKPFIGVVSVQEDKTGQYGPQNNIRRAKVAAAASGNGRPPAARPGPGPSQRPGPAANNNAPAAERRPAAGPGDRPWPKQEDRRPPVAEDEIPF